MCVVFGNNQHLTHGIFKIWCTAYNTCVLVLSTFFCHSQQYCMKHSKMTVFQKPKLTPKPQFFTHRNNTELLKVNAVKMLSITGRLFVRYGLILTL